MNIYIITNKLNKKQYVGLTVRSLHERFMSHYYLSKQNSGFYLHNAMRKYGIENFEISLIDTAQNMDELKKKEIENIKKYDTFYNGYNLTEGGEFTSNAGKTVVIDDCGQCKQITTDEYKTGKYSHINSGKITVFRDNEKIRVTSEEYNTTYYSLGWRSKNHGRTQCIDENGKTFFIDSSKFDKNIHNGVNKDKHLYFNIKTQKFEFIPLESFDVSIHYNANKTQWKVYDNFGRLVQTTLSCDNIYKEFGFQQFRYLIKRAEKNQTEFCLTEEVLNKLKLKNRDYNLVGFKLVKDCLI